MIINYKKKHFRCFLPKIIPNKTNKLRRGKYGGIFYPKDLQVELSILKKIIFDQWKKQKRPFFDTNFSLLVHFCVPDRRARDLDNQIKTLLDLIQELDIIKNDKLCTEVKAQKEYIKGKISTFFEIVETKGKEIDERIDPHFTRKEAACHCGCGFSSMDAELLRILRELRLHLGAIKILSWCRCKKHNDSIGGTPNSYHTKGLAVDLRPLENNLENVMKYLSQTKGIGLGFYEKQKFIHLDVRGYDARWRG